MNDITQNIQRIAARLLEEKTVHAVIGFKQAGLSHMTQPCIARTPEDIKTLVFNANCRMNLSSWLPSQKEKTAIIAKGCDTRNLVIQLTENRIKRDQVYIIGVPCTGMADKQKLMAAAGNEITDMEDQGATLVLYAADRQLALDKEEVLQENCKTCIRRNPVIFDEMAGPEVPELELADRFADVKKIEAFSVQEKQDHFSSLLENCIRCYACRQACPLCYCPTCFVDESAPQWVGKGIQTQDVKTFHLMRAFHDAGRCTDCGACEAACPMNIKVRTFTRKTIKECGESYQVEAGREENVRPALDRCSLNDPQDYIM